MHCWPDEINRKLLFSVGEISGSLSVNERLRRRVLWTKMLCKLTHSLEFVNGRASCWLIIRIGLLPDLMQLSGRYICSCRGATRCRHIFHWIPYEQQYCSTTTRGITPRQSTWTRHPHDCGWHSLVWCRIHTLLPIYSLGSFSSTW